MRAKMVEYPPARLRRRAYAPALRARSSTPASNSWKCNHGRPAKPADGRTTRADPARVPSSRRTTMSSTTAGVRPHAGAREPRRRLAPRLGGDREEARQVPPPVLVPAVRADANRDLPALANADRPPDRDRDPRAGHPDPPDGDAADGQLTANRNASGRSTPLTWLGARWTAPVYRGPRVRRQAAERVRVRRISLFSSALRPFSACGTLERLRLATCNGPGPLFSLWRGGRR